MNKITLIYDGAIHIAYQSFFITFTHEIRCAESGEQQYTAAQGRVFVLVHGQALTSDHHTEFLDILLLAVVVDVLFGEDHLGESTSDCHEQCGHDCD